MHCDAVVQLARCSRLTRLVETLCQPENVQDIWGVETIDLLWKGLRLWVTPCVLFCCKREDNLGNEDAL